MGRAKSTVDIQAILVLFCRLITPRIIQEYQNNSGSQGTSEVLKYNGFSSKLCWSG